MNPLERWPPMCRILNVAVIVVVVTNLKYFASTFFLNYRLALGQFTVFKK